MAMEAGSWMYQTYYGIILLFYLAGSVFLREVQFRSHPEKNEMGTVSALITLGLVGLGLGGAVGFALYPCGSGMFGCLAKLIGIFLGGPLGLILGLAGGYRARETFKTYRLFYYSAPVLVLTLICWLFWIFRDMGE